MSDAAHCAALGVSRSPYPQALDRAEGRLDRLARACQGFAVNHSGWLQRRRLSRIVAVTETAETALARLDDSERIEARWVLRTALRREGLHMDLVGDAFALIRHAAQACFGIRLGDGQLIGGWAALDGHMAEMGPGEGKTLAAVLAAATAALAGRPSHVICASDALARRHGERMTPLYEALGLGLGIIDHDDDEAARRAAYGCDVTYGSSAEMAFDYLRDRMVLGAKTGDIHLMLDRLRGPHGRAGKLIMRGLGFAVIDDADGVLLDQARAPQAISGASATGDERGTAIRAFAVADGLEREVHFTLDADQPRIDISDRGKARIQELIERDNDRRDGPPLRRETVREALMARHLFFRDRHYVVREGRVFILDDRSGEITADRQWAGGLQQLIEVKEGCEPSGRRVTLARMSYQSFFRRYRRLGGLSGVAAEGAAEFWSTYRIPVIVIPAARHGRRQAMPDRVFATADEKLRAIAARVVEMAGRDRPVHIAAPTAEAAAAVAERLSDMGIPFSDISHDESAAGHRGPGAVTLSDAMAGLDAASAPEGRGGLHVIIAEPHESRRADRWLAQRCGWGGAAGSHESFLSLEDAILSGSGGVMLALARWLMPRAPAMGRAFTAAAARGAQETNERNQTKLRRELLMYDRETSRMLSFAGRGE